jgi:DNA-binding beta-propeller fold protein YncE
MRSNILTILTITLAVPAICGPGDVINSFTVAGITEYGPRGLAYDPSADVYYVTTPIHENNVRVIKFSYDGSTPTVISTFTCASELYWPMDAAWEVNLALAEDIDGESVARVLFVEDDSGNIVTSFNGPYGAGTHLNGLTWNGSSLFAASFDSKTVYELTSAGSVVSSFNLPIDGVKGLAWGAGYLWAVVADPYGGYYDDYVIYKLTGTGTVVASYPYELDAVTYVGGACWGRDDQESLLISTYSGDQYIYEIGFAEDATVTPASIGRIKAIYR